MDHSPEKIEQVLAWLEKQGLAQAAMLFGKERYEELQKVSNLSEEDAKDREKQLKMRGSAYHALLKRIGQRIFFTATHG